MHSMQWHKVTPIAPPTGCGIRPVPNRNLAYIARRRHPYIESLPTLWYWWRPALRTRMPKSWHVMDQNYPRFKTDGISKLVSRTIWVTTSKMQTFSREACPQPAPTERKQKNKRVQYLGVVCELAVPLKFKSETRTYNYNVHSKYIFRLKMY